ncbi:hypothetical protein A2U01_0098451, partial [Trifolium medium]|nr:hypothetical protein [Trifolium medium]
MRTASDSWRKHWIFVSVSQNETSYLVVKKMRPRWNGGAGNDV